MKDVMVLLADPSPALRLRVLCELLGRPETDPEVMELRALHPSDPLLTSLLDTQKPDGSWHPRQLPGVSGDEVWATSMALSRLAYLGLDSEHPAIRHGAEFLFSRQQPDGAWPLFMTHDVDEGRVDGTWAWRWRGWWGWRG